MATLIDWNPTLDPRDHAAPLRQGCEILMCQAARSVELHARHLPAKYHFWAEFEAEQGSCFTHGPLGPLAPEREHGLAAIHLIPASLAFSIALARSATCSLAKMFDV